jgi:hypothetical protein
MQMLHVTLGQTDTLTLTLTENLDTQADLYEYLFVARSRASGQYVRFTLKPEDDTSRFPRRYNQFRINTTEVLGGDAPAGQYNYTIYQVRPGETDEAFAFARLEDGLMHIHVATN